MRARAIESCALAVLRTSCVLVLRDIDSRYFCLAPAKSSCWNRTSPICQRRSASVPFPSRIAVWWNGSQAVEESQRRRRRCKKGNFPHAPESTKDEKKRKDKTLHYPSVPARRTHLGCSRFGCPKQWCQPLDASKTRPLPSTAPTGPSAMQHAQLLSGPKVVRAF
jgi:hypothetical protein